VKQRTRSAIVTTVAAIVVASFATAGVVTLRGGLEERRNADLLASPDSVMIATTGTVKTSSGTTSWTQMPVLFDTAEGDRVQTMVWTRKAKGFTTRGERFHAGDTVALEYVSGHPSAARLAGEKSGPARPWRTILMGAGIIVGMVAVVAAGIWDFFAGRRRRGRAPA
jgi:hypothetical protein